jgi:4'-phosphopantetheinyl transferase
MKLNWPEVTEATDLAASDLQVWAVPLDEAGSAGDQLFGVLSDEERRRAARFALDAPRRRFVATRAALRTILGRRLRVAPQDVPIVYVGNGKPDLPSGEVQFNVAHSGELALVAVTTWCAVGVDVELVRPVIQRDEIARRYFAPVEIEAILAMDEPQRTAAFLRCWARKEAVLKAIGTGLGYPLEALSVPVGESVSDWVNLPAHAPLKAARCWLEHINPCTGYVAAVAAVDERHKPVGLTYRY